MGTEIERKFLVRVDRLPTPTARGPVFTQGYLSDKPTVRVRLVVPPTGPEGATAFLTVKGPGTLSRAEFEYAIPAADAEAMLPLCATVLRKVRFLFTAADGHVWEIDRFDGTHAGLWLAEIELSHIEEDFERPAWLGAEVTDDPRYTNVALARAGRAPES